MLLIGRQQKRDILTDLEINFILYLYSRHKYIILYCISDDPFCCQSLCSYIDDIQLI